MDYAENALPSKLLARPPWLKGMMRLMTGQSRREYYISWSRGEISYEDKDHAVVIYAELLVGRPERILRRDLAFSVSGKSKVPVGAEVWALVSERIAADLSKWRVSWRLE